MRKCLSLLMCLALACFFAFPASAEEDNTAEATDLLRQGVEAAAAENHEQAAEYFRRAAELGSSYALTCLGTAYENGLGVEQSYTQAADCYSRAADMGNIQALVSLGKLYGAGLGVEKSDEEAERLFRLAAEQGSADACFQLFLMYNDGRLEEKEEHEAANLLVQAVRGGNPDAQVVVGIAAYNVEDYESAIKYFTEAAAQNHPQALLYLGMLYQYGQGVEQSTETALKYFAASAKLGDETAIYLVAGAYYSAGRYDEAAELYRSAAEKGSADAQKKLEEMAADGLIPAE